MLKIGITGGIGSGKSVVTEIFKVLGAPILDADKFAKALMQDNIEVKNQLLHVFGTTIFDNNVLNNNALATLVFNNKEKLNQLNQIVHPAVRHYGLEWMNAQTQAPYVIKEAALFFECGSNVDMDYIIGVAAPYDLRLQRAMQRDKVAASLIEKRMSNQMEEEKKMLLCDFIVFNDEKQSLIQQVLHLHNQFTNQK